MARPAAARCWLALAACGGLSLAFRVGKQQAHDLEVSDVAARSSAADAQFLIQATFGPTRESLKELEATTLTDWIDAQMKLPASSHREHYRQRVNPREVGPERKVGSFREPCQPGSRWRQFVFDDTDVKKPVTIANGKILIDGKLVSLVDPAFTGNGLAEPPECTNKCWTGRCQCEGRRLNFWHCRSDSWLKERYCAAECFKAGYPYAGDDCSGGWPGFEFSGFLCSASPRVGGVVTFSKAANCKVKVVMRNPGIWLGSDAGLADASAMKFHQLRPGVLILRGADAKAEPQPEAEPEPEPEPEPEVGYDNCALAETMVFAGKHYRHDQRLELVHNTPSHPASALNSDFCPTVAKNILNAKDCKLMPTCMALDDVEAELTLDAALRRGFLRFGKHYVYKVSGLMTSTSPCGTLSRWQRCADCPESSVAAAAQEAIVRALDGQEGALRDVDVNCKGVDAGAVVKVGDDKFQHVHLHTGNVYDFTDWVEAHPGGPDKIKKWAKDDFELVFPSHHPMGRWEAQSTQNLVHFLGKDGATVDISSLPGHLHVDALKIAQGSGAAAIGAGFLACGSPGEVANAPMLGHDYSFMQYFDKETFSDQDYDRNRFLRSSGNVHKQGIWTTIAMHGRDQLRQRVAWALSQVLVVAVRDGTEDTATERWTAFYDIFVRHAFGSYRDLLQEVTYSPSMAGWLTYRRNTAYDYNSFFPDENYAREIMQLFSIGLWKLNPDGSRKKDANGVDLPSYDNEAITNFARVFTGFDQQQERSNLEQTRRGNVIDPLKMNVAWHDVYPKPDLENGYLGDGYPLCSDLPAGAFMHKGAKFEFMGYTYKGKEPVFELAATSALFPHLCNGEAAPCPFAAAVKLPSDVACAGSECQLTSVRVVKVDRGYYEYVPPTCVHMFFFNGRMVARDDDRYFTRTRTCENPDVAVAGTSCCAGCKDEGPKVSLRQCQEFRDRYGGFDRLCNANNDTELACQEIKEKMGETFAQKKCNNHGRWKREKICALSCFEAGAGYDFEDDCSLGAYRGQQLCNFQGELVTFGQAEAQCGAQKMKVCQTKAESTCGYGARGQSVWLPDPCTVDVEVEGDGKVSSQRTSATKQNSFTVYWWKDVFPKAGACPAGCEEVEGGTSCLCSTKVATSRVYKELPSARQLGALTIGAYPPRTAAFAEADGIKAYHSDGQFDENTVFEYQGKYYKNMKSSVRVGSSGFRNPPVFVLKEQPSARAALAEVESLLDHLVHHPNTAPFIGHKLIQRMTSSNPTRKYVRAVAEAFTTGTYDGKTYSGKYGDLGAAVAAVLLHPEAREARTASAGAFREPLLKILHFMRSLEYTDSRHRDFFLRKLHSDLGQFPYMSPTVFNFYKPDYQPPRFDSSHPDLVAPEFEIFTTPEVINFFNGMQEMVQWGLTSNKGNFGIYDDSVRQGHFKVNETTATLELLDVLLTGGRLAGSKATVQKAFDEAPAGSKVLAAEGAIVMSPEFHTLGDPQSKGKRAASTTAEPRDPQSYKAVVVVFMGGGADTFNMLVPMNANCKLYDEYRTVRTNMALKEADLQEIKTTGQACTKFGVHKSLSFLKGLYDEGELGFASNIGNLAEPTTKEDLRAGTVQKCAGLFSHADMQNGAQTLKCQVFGSTPKGSGGRMADALAEQGFSTTSFSVAGAVPWTKGFETFTEMVDRSSGARRVTNLEQLQDVIVNITSVEHKNVYCEEYSQQLAESVAASKKLADIFDGAKLETDGFETNTNGLAQQLKQVARLIVSRGERKAERDFFFVSVGGWDMHADLINGMEARLGEVDSALETFVKEMRAQAVWKDVVVTTMSDFGRTLVSNGKGSDHAWAGNHMVMGGSVKGGRVYNRFPESLLLGSKQDVGKGRLVPMYPWESVFAPIARWVGVGEDKLANVFPNLAKFNASNHIIEGLF